MVKDYVSAPSSFVANAHNYMYAFYTGLMYKTAVYTLVNGAIAHQKTQISKNVILHSMTLPKCQCTAEQYHIFYICGFWCV